MDNQLRIMLWIILHVYRFLATCFSFFISANRNVRFTGVNKNVNYTYGKHACM